VFEAHNAGTAIRLHAGQVLGPAQGGASDGVRINAFILWDGRHYCTLDWHVISINLTDGNFAGESRTPREIAAALSALQVSYVLDGTALQLQRTPVKPDLNPAANGFVNAFYFTSGRVMAPEDIAVGQHTLAIVVIDPSGPIDQSQITFFVDAAGTGACL
jgi:hypothetical protein